MNKSKMILAATGGVMGLLVLVMAYLVWTAYAAKTAAEEGDDEGGVTGLRTVVEQAGQLSGKKIYPCAASVQMVESNRTVVAAWKDEAFRLAARGDRPVKATTPAQFKADIVDEAKRLIALPGGVQGKLAKPEFAFGPFREYIAEGKMPVEQNLRELQRQWDDLVTILETLSSCGIVEVLDFQVKKAEAPKEEASGKNRKAKKGAKGQEPEAVGPASYTYAVTFTTRPVALVRSVNAFETCERFVIVNDFSFSRERDALAEALGGDEKKAAAEAASRAGGRRRGRRGAAQVQEEQKPEEPKNSIVTDPLLDEPVKVQMNLSVYDFRTLENGAKAAEEVKK